MEGALAIRSCFWVGAAIRRCFRWLAVALFEGFVVAVVSSVPVSEAISLRIGLFSGSLGR